MLLLLSKPKREKINAEEDQQDDEQEEEVRHHVEAAVELTPSGMGRGSCASKEQPRAPFQIFQ